MAKKFGKILLFTAAVGTAAAAIHYYMQKKESENTVPEDEDYDDFSEDLDEESDSSRSYVPLTPESKSEDKPEEKNTEGESDTFTPLEQVAKSAEEAAAETAETVEEFFDEDSSDEEPPIQDN